MQTEKYSRHIQYIQKIVNVLFSLLSLYWRALHIGRVPLGLKTTGLLFLCALRLPFSTAGSLARSRQAGESYAMFPPGSDRAALGWFSPVQDASRCVWQPRRRASHLVHRLAAAGSEK